MPDKCDEAPGNEKNKFDIEQSVEYVVEIVGPAMRATSDMFGTIEVAAKADADFGKMLVEYGLPSAPQVVRLLLQAYQQKKVVESLATMSIGGMDCLRKTAGVEYASLLT